MITNSHIHTFRDEDVPSGFLPFGMVNICRNDFAFKILGGIMSSIIPFTNKDIVDRYRQFVEISRLGGQKEIFENVFQYYPSDTKFIVQPMDMDYMKAGKTKRKYESQLEELAMLRDAYPNNIIPFIAVDPRRSNIEYLVKYFVGDRGFKGIKYYHPNGYFPYDQRLIAINEFAQDKGLPIMSHCSASGAVYYRGSKNEIRELLKGSKGKVKYDGNEIALCSNFTDPENYKYVLEDFPKLKVCLAHWGGENSWKEYLEKPKNQIPDNWFMRINEMLKQYNNLYTDVSYLAADRTFWSLIKVMCSDPIIGSKVLYGSDYYMASIEGSERIFAIEFRAFLGEDIFNRISNINPGNYIRY